MTSLLASRSGPATRSSQAARPSRAIKRLVAVFAFIAGAFAPSLGCSEKSCQVYPCPPTVKVTFHGMNGVPGLYRVDLVADGLMSTCQIALPFDCGTRATCTPPVPGWQLQFSGCSFDGSTASRATVDGFELSDTPSNIEFVVRRNDEVIGGGKVAPSYAVSFPSGPDCEICREAPDIAIDLE